VTFVIAGSHDAREVSQSTWNASSTSSWWFSSSTWKPAQHLWVLILCVYQSCGWWNERNIIVQNTTGVVENTSQATISVSPNPSQGKFQMIVSSMRH
jgi:hypothetical protein